MDAVEFIDDMVKKLEPILEENDLNMFKQHQESHIDEIQAYLDKYYPPEELLEQKADEFVESLAADAPEGFKKKMREVYIKEYYGGESLAKSFGISDDALNTAYTLGYTLYANGQYKEAYHYFFILTFFDANDPNYQFGFAATLHMLKEYERAINHYWGCISLDFDNPIPWFHMADCYMKLGNLDMALVCIKAVLIRVEGDKDYQAIQKKAELMKSAVMEKIQKSRQESKESASAAQE